MTKKLQREDLILYLHVVHGWHFSVRDVRYLEERAGREQWRWNPYVLSTSDTFVGLACRGISELCRNCWSVGSACLCYASDVEEVA
jgi:hypothetical protein